MVDVRSRVLATSCFFFVCSIRCAEMDRLLNVCVLCIKLIFTPIRSAQDKIKGFRLLVLATSEIRGKWPNG